jgi:hypothetical protein
MNRILEGPRVQLSQYSIRHVFAQSLAVQLLLVGNEVLSGRLHTSFLHALNRLCHHDPLEVRIRAKTLPVAAAVCEFAQRTSGRPELYIDAELLGLGAEEEAALADKIDIPCTGGMDPGGKGCDTLDVANSQWAIL